MKLAEIKRHNEEMSAKSVPSDLIFFIQLYHHCIKALEMVPTEFISDMYFVDSICFGTNRDGNTVVSFTFHDHIGKDYCHDYVIKGIKLESHHFDVMFPIQNTDNDVVIFWIENDASENFNLDKAKDIFGDNLILFDDDLGLLRIEVSSKCLYF